MTSPLTDEARAVLRSMGSWLVVDMLLEESGRHYARQSFWGGSVREPFGDTAWFQCERRGVLVTQTLHPPAMFDADGFLTEEGIDHAVRHELLLIRWSEIAQHGRRLPGPVRRQLEDARREYSATNQAWTAPRFSVRYPRRDLTPPQRAAQARLLRERRAAAAQLDRALVEALSVETSEQLDLFAVSA